MIVIGADGCSESSMAEVRLCRPNVWRRKSVPKRICRLPISRSVIGDGDHHLGIGPLREAWPEAVTVSHSFTRAVMGSTLMDVSARNPDAAPPGALRGQLEGALDNPDLPEANRLWLEQGLVWVDLIEAQGRAGQIPEIDLVFEGQSGDRSGRARGQPCPSRVTAIPKATSCCTFPDARHDRSWRCRGASDAVRVFSSYPGKLGGRTQTPAGILMWI